MAIGARIRFEVLKRDGFRCQYCGDEPPGVVLQVDHIRPSAKGGTDDMSNLISSCWPCNLGKGAIGLDESPSAIREASRLPEAEFWALRAKMRSRRELRPSYPELMDVALKVKE
jgi:5-methylcytosine-specific restriction endonuclease McrA